MNAVRWLDRKIVGFFGGTGNIKLAQGLEIILVVIHKRLAEHFRRKYPSADKSLSDRLASAVLKDLFPRKGVDPKAGEFDRENRRLIEESLASLAEDVPELCKEITMALYVLGIVDEPLGEDTRALFQRATELGIFSAEVTIPQPGEFLKHALELARSSGLGTGD